MTKKSRKSQPASTLRKTTFKEKNHGLTRQEIAIAKAPIEAIVNEYNLIQKKESKLSRHLRDVVEMKIQFYIKEGKIKRPDLLKNAKK
jgi:hypothetical protein